MDFILSFDGVKGKVLSDGIMFDIAMKPVLPFTFDSVYYETPTGLAFKYIGGIKYDLTKGEIEDCKKYSSSFHTTANYEVHAYDKFDGLYIGKMMRTDAEKAAYGWNALPPDEALSFWKDGRWQRIHAIITQEGNLLIQPDRVPGNVGKMLTEAEFSLMPPQPNPLFVWDFVNNAWKDPRVLEKVKQNAYLTIRNIFEGARWRANGKFIPQFEQDTWRIQEAEARAFTENAAAPTPFIDAFLAGRTNPPTKAALAADIIANADAYAKAVAGVNAQQWNWLKRVEVATTNAEVDTIIEELQAWDKTQQTVTGR